MNERPIIELRGVAKSFKGCAVLKNIDFTLLSGQSISICGASGVGKTTLLNVISLLEQPDCGTVLWDGEAASGGNISPMRRSMFGFIFQNPNLLYELNVMENILLPLRVHGYPAKEDINFADSLLKIMGMGDRKRSSITVLSGGERQRVALIRALINRPPVILADEPTGNLDEGNARSALDLMVGACRQNSNSLLLITHNQRLAGLTDETFVLANGELIPQQEARRKLLVSVNIM
ncbi:MAG: ATP-binding cassette domain-containing protein [Puniceicoccales bacterium]|jgi:lipoprotein-releasing system ATP-binding protein|nr:ATP-binding cassette domain-containing protein [Puniceicoccales bacterium]